ncbi:translation elongation factor Ts [Lysinibacter sp. HNR]|uniref:translation elongation factor Ts n=1 Tax=Lysinibacter sp. HNR TaxID=3031408 RepID=UPI0024353BE5|nr:translation elongation factor Ts [Lysinibacter sp. HNR]WGD38425.1 translation elongation factor Ts [Lysinibacter sp. HNR]
MANVSLEAVKTLRERLGAGMVDSKNALIEADGDIEKAVEILRLKGMKGVAKREGRSASEGLVAAQEHGSATTLIELVCETDFVSKNEKFIALANTVLDSIVAAGARTREDALAAPLGGKTVADAIQDEAAILGEKVELRGVAVVEGEKFAVYLHKTNKDLPPQVGVVVGYSGDDAETARAVAQHISFADPLYVSREDVPAADIERERQLVTEIAQNEGKPEAALPKIIEGRINGFFKTIVLMDQDYARDNKQSVSQVLGDAGLTVSGFARFKVGA